MSDAGRTNDAEPAYRRSVQIYEALWSANPENIAIGDGLARSLNNLGNLLSDAGRTDDAEPAYRRSVQIREALWSANPENIEIKAGYASSLCGVGRLVEARRLIDEVLLLLPHHSYANQLREYIEARLASS